MTSIENIFEHITDKIDQTEAQKAILESLSLTVKHTEELFTTELMNKVDNDCDEKIPVKKLVELGSNIGVNTKDTSFHDIHDFTTSYIQPFLEDSSCLVTKIIPRLLAYSLYQLFGKKEMNCKNITRRYIFTDRTAIYKLEFLICAFNIPCPTLFPSLNCVYCIVGSKSTVDINRIDFPTLVHFYQRQLIAHGIEEKALNYLFYEFKDTYYALKSTRHYPHNYIL